MKDRTPNIESIVRSNVGHFSGGTWYFTTSKNIGKRYIVGNGNDGFILPKKQVLQGSFGDRLDKGISAWKEEREYDGFGVWLDPETSLVYFDPIRSFNSLDKALDLGAQNNEQCIFDSELNEVIGV